MGHILYIGVYSPASTAYRADTALYHIPQGISTTGDKASD